jgi:ABC-2 type transport system permease protein
MERVMTKPQKYSNTKATLALAKASFRSILRSPSAVIFTLAFPLIFIVVFGFIGTGGITIKVAVSKLCNKENPVYAILEKTKIVNLIENKSEADITADLQKGSIDGLLLIEKNKSGLFPAYTVHLSTSEASPEKATILKSVLSTIFYKINAIEIPKIADLKETVVKGREFKSIDFILPGQLGFSLLSSGVFGTAFVFISLRLTLVIKRFFATPVKRSSIVIGEAFSRMVFSLLGAAFIILLGHFVFGFTLIHGISTVLNMLVLSALGLIVFMGFGFAVSGIAKNESAVPPIANIITLPQFLLAGTFFSIDLFPPWLRAVSKVLPLTYLNDALRKVAFEGASLLDVRNQIFVLILWGIGIYALAVKVFKWE